MRKILYISGTRADYGPARRLLLKLNAHPDIELCVLAMGMHLDPMHGETWQEIQRDGLNVECLPGRLAQDSTEGMAASVGLYLYGISSTLARTQPDIVLVLGDRGEQLAGAIAASYQNITVAHLCGGTLSGSIDDSVRHAITKFAHFHFPAFTEASRRIIQMGEDPEHVHVVGLPGGNINYDTTFTRQAVCESLGIDSSQPYILVIQHAVTHSEGHATSQITETMEAVAASSLTTLLANPNDDAGGRSILKTMQMYAKQHANLKLFAPPRSREFFASVMKHAAVLVGNSSSGIVEAMSVALPVVNIGDRQSGRENLACLLNSNYNRDDIRQAIDKALTDLNYRKTLDKCAKKIQTMDTESLILHHLLKLDIQIASRGKTFFKNDENNSYASHLSPPKKKEGNNK